MGKSPPSQQQLNLVTYQDIDYLISILPGVVEITSQFISESDAIFQSGQRTAAELNARELHNYIKAIENRPTFSFSLGEKSFALLNSNNNAFHLLLAAFNNERIKFSLAFIKLNKIDWAKQIKNCGSVLQGNNNAIRLLIFALKNKQENFALALISSDIDWSTQLTKRDLVNELIMACAKIKKIKDDYFSWLQRIITALPAEKPMKGDLVIALCKTIVEKFAPINISSKSADENESDEESSEESSDTSESDDETFNEIDIEFNKCKQLLLLKHLFSKSTAEIFKQEIENTINPVLAAKLIQSLLANDQKRFNQLYKDKNFADVFSLVLKHSTLRDLNILFIKISDNNGTEASVKTTMLNQVKKSLCNGIEQELEKANSKDISRQELVGLNNQLVDYKKFEIFKNCTSSSFSFNTPLETIVKKKLADTSKTILEKLGLSSSPSESQDRILEFPS